VPFFEGLAFMNGSNPFEELLKDTFAGSMDEHTHTHTHTQHNT